jgi:LuxR family maltose regulon positive regulatory protein
MLTRFMKTGNELFVVRIGTLLSIAYFKTHRPAEAERLFRDTMEKAERGEFVRSVVDQGAETGKLLAALIASLKGKEASARLHNHCERMLKACVGSTSGTTEKAPTLKEHTGSPLTPKEHDVLALIASGQSNKEIARSLNVAPETIKTHLKNIFFKLSVDRRIQAVAKAQALGLLARNTG